MPNEHPDLWLPTAMSAELLRLREDNDQFAEQYPGNSADQPDHTLYGGANLYGIGHAAKISKIADGTLKQYVADPATLAEVFGLGADELPLAETVLRRVQKRVAEGVVGDFRIDFEDGYGYRPDAEEDGHAVAAAESLAANMEAGAVPNFSGFRIKAFTNECMGRSLRTLELFLHCLAEKTGGAVPPNFRMTIPKITTPAQVEFGREALLNLSEHYGIAEGAIGLDLMIETPTAVIGTEGQIALWDLIDAGEGLVKSIAYGTYDDTALVGIIAAHQTHDHDAAMVARVLIQRALAGTGITWSDGATTKMPIGPHNAKQLKRDLGPREEDENRAAVHAGLRLYYDDTMHSLKRGWYQRWVLNPGQFVAHYTALYLFFLRALPDATSRLRRFLDATSKATLTGASFDDAATGQGLLNYFVRAHSCGAVTEEEVLATGITMQELHGRSFMAIMRNRTEGSAPASANA